jgi:hypothetical protein
MAEIGWSGFIGGEDEPEPPYDPKWVESIYEALIQAPPSEFPDIFWACGDDHDHERRAAVGMVVDYINDQLATYRPGTAQVRDALARADELQRITMGD